MNNQSPLVPQGSLLEQKNKGRVKVKVAVFVVLAVHGVGLLALLMQGCKKEAESPLPHATEQIVTNAVVSNAPPAFEPTNPLPQMTSPPPAAVAPPTTPPPPVVPEAPAATDYKIAAGDKLSTIAKNHHITVKNLMDANPGVEPTKLQIGQTIHIPAAVGTPTAVSPAAAPETPSNEQTYTVKSGDTLSSIAHEKHVTIRGLRSANSLKTDSIKVGQKLKIPAPATSSTAPTTPVEPSTTPTGTSAPPSTPSGR